MSAFDESMNLNFDQQLNGKVMEPVSEILSQLEIKLMALQGQPIAKNAFVGFDGFVDSIRKAVRSRDGSGVHHYQTLVEFADRIKQASGRSGQIEMDVQCVKPGGNAPILSSALGNVKIPTTCAGSIDHPVFKTLADRCQTISILPPGESDAIEFEDGKIILSDLSTFAKYDWNYVKQAVGFENLKAIVTGSQMIALVDWANIAHAENIWEGLFEEIIKPSRRKDFMFFFDLCDPSKKSSTDINDILDVISDFSYCGTVTLGLNENEALAIWSALTGGVRRPSIEEAGKFIHYTMNINNLLIHPIDRTLVFTRNEMIELPGRLVTKPKIQTGGGDNLNAGFILGQMAGLSIEESMVLGMAASGFYIQEGKSADLAGLLEYIKTWKEEIPSNYTRDEERRDILFSLPTHL